MKNRFFRPNFPFDPARCRFFYGWIILFAGMLGFFFSLPGHSGGISVFTDEILSSLRIGRVEYSFAYMMGTLLSAITLPWGGRQFDKHGARKVEVAVLLLFGSILLLVSRLIGWVGNQVVQEWMRVGFIFIFFYMMRFCGQGMLTMVSRTMFIKWFSRKRGLVSAISSSFQSISYGLSPLVFGGLIALSSDWRDVWLWIGLFLILVAVPFAWLLFRDRPEACGLEMDGGPSKAALLSGNPIKAVAAEVNWTAAEAVATPFFWILLLGMVMLNFSNTGLALHLDSVGQSMGIEREQIRCLFLLMSFVSIGTNFLSSWFSHKFGVVRLLKAQMLVQVGAAIVFPFLGTEWGWYSFIFFAGAALGSFGILNSLLWAHMYGRKHLGSIVGWTMSTAVVASSLGPVTYSSAFTYGGSYGYAGIVMGFFSLLVFVVLQLKIFKHEKRIREGKSKHL